MSFQQTLQQEVTAVGVGLHSGKPIRMTLKPAPPRTGIVFVRTDLNGASVKADIRNIDFKALQMATTLRNGEALVQTTEHLISALYGAGIDNVIVELNGPEVPIMDGSSVPFLVLIEEAGIKRQRVPRQILKIEKPFHYEKDGKRMSVTPHQGFKVTYDIFFDHPLIGKQNKQVSLDANAYESQIAPARTFGFLKDLAKLKSMGLIKGGSLDNAVVLDGDRILNERLRLDDEFVSHKILDMIGDLAIGGYRLEGHFTGLKAGHEMHALFLRALLASDCYTIVTAEIPESANYGSIQEAIAGAA